MQTINKPTVIAAIEKVLDRYGRDTNYFERFPHHDVLACQYVDSEIQIPACIVGVVMVEEFGVPLHAFAEAEGSKPTQARFWDALSPYVEISVEALDFLSEVQGYQDARDSWGEAVDKALGE